MAKQLLLFVLLTLATCGADAEALGAWFPPPPPLVSGSNGPAVEDLQRTLNARLKPSPGLAVDGDFGPNTEKAVRRFQQLNKLPVTGRVDAATMRLLLPAASRDDAVGLRCVLARDVKKPASR